MPGGEAHAIRSRTIVTETNNRPDEWHIEQGMQGAKLPIIDQSGPETLFIHPVDPPEISQDQAAIDAMGDREKIFAAERKGWRGYVEWEEYPEKKAKARKILTSQTFPPTPDYMTGPVPGTNPVLQGDDFTAWHHAIGGELATAPEDSWDIVLREKHKDMLHLLKFPYNGEPSKRLVTSKAITPNSLHFV